MRVGGGPPLCEPGEPGWSTARVAASAHLDTIRRGDSCRIPDHTRSPPSGGALTTAILTPPPTRGRMIGFAPSPHTTRQAAPRSPPAPVAGRAGGGSTRDVPSPVPP